jgi:hypothetical protein
VGVAVLTRCFSCWSVAGEGTIHGFGLVASVSPAVNLLADKFSRGRPCR